MAENMPMVAGIDVYAKETVIGGAGDEDSASLHRRLHSHRCRSCNGRNRRAFGPLRRLRGLERAQSRSQCLHRRTRGQQDSCVGVLPRV